MKIKHKITLMAGGITILISCVVAFVMIYTVDELLDYGISWQASRVERSLPTFEKDAVMQDIRENAAETVATTRKVIIAENLIGLFLILLCMLVISRYLTGSVSTINAFASSLAKGEIPSGSLHAGGPREAEELVNALNHIRDRLSTMMIKVKKSFIREVDARHDAESLYKIKSDFLVNILKDMREPLGTLESLTAVWGRGLEGKSSNDPESQKRNFAATVACLNSINEMVSMLQELSYLDADGASFPEKTKFESAQVLKEIMAAIRKPLLEKDIAVERRFSAEIPHSFRTDRKKLSRMLVIIYQGLIKAAKAGSVINAAFMADGETYSFVFSGKSDNHAAINYVMYNTEARRLDELSHPASVISLTLAKNIAHSLGAECDITCDDAKYEIRVTFQKDDLVPTGASLSDTTAQFFPTWQGAGEADGIQRRSKTTILKDLRRMSKLKKDMKILVAEDDSSSRTLIEAILGNTGCSITVVSTPEECGSRIMNEVFDVIIVDVHMPDIDPVALISAIRNSKNGREPYLIILSAFIEEGEKDRLLSAGANSIILKPINPEELSAAVFGSIA